VMALCKGVPAIRWQNWRPRLDRDVSQALLGYGALLFVSAMAAGGSQLLVRDLLISAQGAASAGHWQAVVRVSEALIIIITSVLTSYYLPKLSEANRVERNALLRHYLSRIIPAFAAITLGVIALREPIILLLFTRDFLPAGDLFASQFAGDVMRMTGWIANIALLAAGRTRSAMVGELCYAAAFIGLSSIYIPAHGPAAATHAYLAANIVAAMVLWILLLRGRGDVPRMPSPSAL
jgi:O-antigen/teichoic acid export membrane protein